MDDLAVEEELDNQLQSETFNTINFTKHLWPSTENFPRRGDGDGQV